jgi:hypothetical protein
LSGWISGDRLDFIKKLYGLLKVSNLSQEEKMIMRMWDRTEDYEADL